MNEPTHIGIRGGDGRVFCNLPILRNITLRGISGFCIHQYEDEFRVSHVETGSYLTRAGTDGEAFTQARRFDRVELESKITATRRELKNLGQLQERGVK